MDGYSKAQRACDRQEPDSAEYDMDPAVLEVLAEQEDGMDFVADDLAQAFGILRPSLLVGDAAKLGAQVLAIWRARIRRLYDYQQGYALRAIDMPQAAAMLASLGK